ncbi:hypothetical protein [Afifella sp. IM 167]|uniref:hypothetical protein n=1 Tax=Afifella sp. IM 167 TaxID=2033586 RepID=UPI001CCBCED3|nr:hypothetical protein [Afifella sp. IM 167]MBZ8131665.1 hypothetical protein [Afifella sp. IM 167]
MRITRLLVSLFALGALAAFSGSAQAQSAKATVGFMLAGVSPGGEEKRVVDAENGIRTVTPSPQPGEWRLKYVRALAQNSIYTLVLNHRLEEVDACRYELHITGKETQVTMKFDFSRATEIAFPKRDPRAPDGTTLVDYLGASVERCEPSKDRPCQEVDGNRFGYIPASEAELRAAFDHFQATICAKSIY